MKTLSMTSAIAVVTVILLVVYAAVQQTYRMDANDPQIQMARDISVNLKEGKSIEHIFPVDSVDISESLGVFAVLYDRKSKPIKSSGFLHGNIPQIPPGIFDFVKSHGEDMVTWQPQPGVRMAIVVASVHAPDISFVAVGRSLKEVEAREHNLLLMLFAAWLICIGIIAVNSFIQMRFQNR